MTDSHGASGSSRRSTRHHRPPPAAMLAFLSNESRRTGRRIRPTRRDREGGRLYGRGRLSLRGHGPERQTLPPISGDRPKPKLVSLPAASRLALLGSKIYGRPSTPADFGSWSGSASRRERSGNLGRPSKSAGTTRGRSDRRSVIPFAGGLTGSHCPFGVRRHRCAPGLSRIGRIPGRTAPGLRRTGRATSIV